jgi:hypothetical protein
MTRYLKLLAFNEFFATLKTIKISYYIRYYIFCVIETQLPNPDLRQAVHTYRTTGKCNPITSNPPSESNLNSSHTCTSAPPLLSANQRSLILRQPARGVVKQLHPLCHHNLTDPSDAQTPQMQDNKALARRHILIPLAQSSPTADSATML